MTVFHQVQLALSQKHKRIRSSHCKKMVIYIRIGIWGIGETVNLKCCSNSTIFPYVNILILH